MTTVTARRRPGSGWKGTLARLAWFLGPFLALLAVWEAAVRITGVPTRVFPSVGETWAAGVELAADGAVWEHTFTSVRRVVVGSTLAVVLAIPFGMAMGINRKVAAFFTPLLRFSVALAGIAWIPMATLWFGSGEGAVTFIIFNAVFFSLVYNTMLGVSRIPRDLQRAARSLGVGRARMLWDVLLPGAMPSIVTGLRVGLGFGWRGLIAAEIIATNLGLGYLLFLAQKFYRTDQVVLSMVIIGVLWVLLDRLLLARLEERTIQRWGMKRAVR